MTAHPTGSYEHSAKKPQLRFRYDSEDSNYAAVARQRKQEEREVQQRADTTRKKRKRKENATGRALRDMLDLPLSFEFRGKHIMAFTITLVLIVLYVYNGYTIQGQQVRISRLQDTLTRVKFDVLSTSSRLMQRTRKSEIHKYLNENSDSTFEAAPTPPYVID